MFSKLVVLFTCVRIPINIEPHGAVRLHPKGRQLSKKEEVIVGAVTNDEPKFNPRIIYIFLIIII
jgi:hypothetical protein